MPVFIEIKIDNEIQWQRVRNRLGHFASGKIMVVVRKLVDEFLEDTREQMQDDLEQERFGDGNRTERYLLRKIDHFGTLTNLIASRQYLESFTIQWLGNSAARLSPIGVHHPIFKGGGELPMQTLAEYLEYGTRVMGATPHWAIWKEEIPPKFIAFVKSKHGGLAKFFSWSG